MAAFNANAQQPKACHPSANPPNPQPPSANPPIAVLNPRTEEAKHRSDNGVEQTDARRSFGGCCAFSDGRPERRGLRRGAQDWKRGEDRECERLAGICPLQ